MVSRSSPTRPVARTAGRKGRGRPKTKEARRRYNIALGTRGAEMRLPAVPVIHVGWRLFSGMLVVFLIYALNTVWTSPQFRVDNIDISGIERLSVREVITVLNIAGSPVFAINPDVVAAALEKAYPELTDISVKISLPATVQISVGERIPVLAWEQAGIETWVDQNGIGFLDRGQAPDLIRVVAADRPPLELNGEVSEQQFISPKLVQAIIVLNEFAPENTQLLYDPEHGFGWVDPEKNWQVYFGHSPEDMRSRLDMYEVIVAALKKKGIKPVFISLEYLHAPYYRMVP